VSVLDHCLRWVAGDRHQASFEVSLLAGRGASRVRACAGPSALPRLDDYSSAVVGQGYHVDARRHEESGEWVPVQANDPTAMAFDNLPAFPALVGARGPVRLEIEVRARHTPADERIGWHAPYLAHVREVCRP